jgi:hypothetical protein
MQNPNFRDVRAGKRAIGGLLANRKGIEACRSEDAVQAAAFASRDLDGRTC